MKRTSLASHGTRVVAAAILVSVLAACSGEKPDAMLASARDYITKNDYKAAVIQAKNALQANPDLPAARYLLGLALLRSGDPVGGEAELRKAKALKHPDDEVVPPLAQAMLMQGQAKKTIDEFGSQVLSQPRAKAELQTYLSAAYASVGKADLATSALDAALAADPAFVPAQIAMARRRAGAGEFDVAIAALDSILAKTPADQDALKLKGDVLMYGKNQADDAVAAYRKAVQAKPDFLAGHMTLLNVLLRQGKLDDASKQLEVVKKLAANHPQTKYYETLLAFQKKDYKLAKELSQQLMKIAPDNVQALSLAGAAELQSNSLVQAETYLAKAVQAAPGAVLARRMLTTTYLRTGQPAKALATMEPLLKDADSNPATSALAGEVYLQNGDMKKAEEYFGKAAKLDPKNARSRTALALTHLASGKDAGFEELQNVAASDDGVTADLALISVHLRRNELDQALKAIAGLEKKQPGKPLASNLRGRTLLAKKDIVGARKAFEQSLSIDPIYFPSVAALAAMDLAEKKPDEARKRFDAVLAKNPKHVQSLLALAELRARAGGPKEEVAELITRAVNADPVQKAAHQLLIDFHLRNNDFKLALSAAQNAVAAIPDSPELLDGLGRAQQLSGDGNQALITFNKMAGLQPRSPLGQMRMADVNLLVIKDKAAAGQNLRKALEIKPDLLDAQRGLILLAMDGKKDSEAIEIARNVQKQRPKEAIGYIMEGDIASSQKKWEPAIEAYRKGLKQASSPELAVKLYSALTISGKAADKDKFAQSWLSEHPKDVAMRLFLGDESISFKRLPDAEKYYTEVTKISPNNAIAYNNLAWVTGQLKKPGAVALAEKAIALAPNQPAFIDTLAMLHSDNNDYAKALELQTKALTLQPENGAYKLNLAKIHIKGGKKDLARKELEALAKLGDKFPAQVQVAALLKDL